MTRAGGRFRVVPFDRKVHERADFDCGAPELDLYIRNFAAQDAERDYARVFVAVEMERQRVEGYYAVSATSFAREGLPAEKARKLPRYPVPAALLARLAVDRRRQGEGLGAFMLIDALMRILRGNEAIAVHAIAVDARDDEAAAFYAKFGFIRFVDSPRRLFLPTVTVRKLVGE